MESCGRSRSIIANRNPLRGYISNLRRPQNPPQILFCSRLEVTTRPNEPDQAAKRPERHREKVDRADLPSGPAIILVAGAIYLFSVAFGPFGGLIWLVWPRRHLEA